MIDWHYPRPELAQAHLAQLFDQGLSRLAFFGRRRIGKTEYLRRDLIPAAQAKGVVDTFYCSFWENKDHPQLALIRALQDALPEKQAKAKAKAGLNLGVLDFSAEVERADRPKPALPNELTLAATSFQQWVKHLAGNPGLIVLDEIQHLATSSAFATFAATLRTLLDMAPANIAVIFTGSSLLDLQRLFNEQRAPFFNFATVVDFPLLDRPFIEHLTSIHHEITGLALEAEPLWELFNRSGRNAQVITGLVSQMVLRKSADIQATWQDIEIELTGDGGWCEKLWLDLLPSDQAVYLLLREGEDLFSESSLALYGQLNFSRGAAQQAIKRLINRSLIIRNGHGRYERIVPILDDWLKQAGKTSQGLVPTPTSHAVTPSA
ncbi:MAG: hypothetical protein LWW81_05350 [Rhodocyclales bacterium]|nr:hypothetical protein [Rhodocyclales bacterium]